MGIAKFVTTNVNEEDLEALRKAVVKMEKAVESNPEDVRSAAEADEDFHLAYCRAAHNKILENMARPVITHGMVRFWKQSRSPSHEFGRAAIEGHREIVEAVQQGMRKGCSGGGEAPEGGIRKNSPGMKNKVQVKVEAQVEV